MFCWARHSCMSHRGARAAENPAKLRAETAPATAVASHKMGDPSWVTHHPEDFSGVDVSSCNSVALFRHVGLANVDWRTFCKIHHRFEERKRAERAKSATPSGRSGNVIGTPKH